jgi:hypothetical protein
MHPRDAVLAPNCPKVKEICDREIPNLQEIEPGHRIACWQIEKKT